MSNPSTTPLATFLQLKYKFDSYAKLINNFTTREDKTIGDRLFENQKPEAWIKWKNKMAEARTKKGSSTNANWKITFQKEFYQKIIAVENKYDSPRGLQKYQQVCNLKLTKNLELFLDNFFSIFDELLSTLQMYKNISNVIFTHEMFDNLKKDLWENKIQLTEKALGLMEFIYEEIVNEPNLFQSDKYHKKIQSLSDAMKNCCMKIKKYQDTYKINIEDNNLENLYEQFYHQFKQLKAAKKSAENLAKNRTIVLSIQDLLKDSQNSR
ncbi:hypothetical protein [Spiroplasma sp. DGKH1]|uniref:hypothetical protein n=1 Tax=Spiroplasma sp. DGKH1 TaxID=3050074 RepID=UPI0034C65E64